MFYVLLQLFAHSLLPKSFFTNDCTAEAVHISATIPIAVALINLVRPGLEAHVLVEPVSAFPVAFVRCSRSLRRVSRGRRRAGGITNMNDARLSWILYGCRPQTVAADVCSVVVGCCGAVCG